MSGKDGGELINIVNSLSISAENARKTGERALKSARSKSDNAAAEDVIRTLAASIIIQKYSRSTALTSAVSALPSVVPGWGTAISVTGGVTVDLIASLRLQVDMCKCLAVVYGYEIESPDVQHLCMLLALCGTLEKAGAAQGTSIATKAGVKMLRMYLRGPILVVIKEAFKKIGITLTRKQIERAIPFVGVPISGATSFAFTRFIGWNAQKWMEIDTTYDKAAIDAESTVDLFPTEFDSVASDGKESSGPN